MYIWSELFSCFGGRDGAGYAGCAGGLGLEFPGVNGESKKGWTLVFDTVQFFGIFCVFR